MPASALDAHTAPPLPGAGRTLAVVLNWCAEEDTARCIGSLQAEQAVLPTLDILLADSASPDGSGDRLAARFPEVTYLPIGANLGYAGGNQRAIEWALERGYAFVLLINDDAEVRLGCVRRLVEVLVADPRVGACAPTITFGPPHEEVVWWAGGRFVWWKAIGVHEREGVDASVVRQGPQAPQAAEFLSGCVLLLRAEAIRRSGGLRADFFAYVEDAELCVRWQRDGWGLRWVPDAWAVHHTPFGAQEPSPFAITLRDRNRRRLAARHLGVLRRLVFVLFFGMSRAMLMVRYARRGDMRRCMALLRGMVGTTS